MIRCLNIAVLQRYIQVDMLWLPDKMKIVELLFFIAGGDVAFTTLINQLKSIAKFFTQFLLLY